MTISAKPDSFFSGAASVEFNIIDAHSVPAVQTFNVSTSKGEVTGNIIGDLNRIDKIVIAAYKQNRQFIGAVFSHVDSSGNFSAELNMSEAKSVSAFLTDNRMMPINLKVCNLS